MNDFDKYIKNRIEEENFQVPEQVNRQIEESLSQLSQERKVISFRGASKLATIAACFIIVTLVILPNFSLAYANALVKIPIIGSIIKVVTIGNYQYADKNLEIDVKTPALVGEKGNSIAFINEDVGELTQMLVDQFDEDMEKLGEGAHKSVTADYKVVTDTEKWFTLQIKVTEIAGSSDTYYKYYHIDKYSGEIVKIDDLFKDRSYRSVLEEVKDQMRDEMAKDENVSYWVDDPLVGEDFVAIDEEQNFYWDKKENLVLVYDKYEVGPGSMGTPKFTIKRAIFEDMLKKDYK